MSCGTDPADIFVLFVIQGRRLDLLTIAQQSDIESTCMACSSSSTSSYSCPFPRSSPSESGPLSYNPVRNRFDFFLALLFNPTTGAE
ncbi:hypothetical protein M413DRAFT_446246 [Hebeloma cylindrosporum]|uniref:Uncharacterized protein n=1 Tax=Hebeloma cylindrosporum TaxID=76867 RepID=A0A0C3C966_HEBCY|nr:hypothetical protein M413DRAFT_446246 [Hebeloma cylindrosporum h7]